MYSLMNGAGLSWAMATGFSRAKVVLMKRWSDTVMLLRNVVFFLCLLAASVWSSLAVSSSNMWFLWSVLWVPLINRVWKSAADNQRGDEQKFGVPVGSADSNILYELSPAKATHPALHEDINSPFISKAKEKDNILMYVLCQMRSSLWVQTAFADKQEPYGVICYIFICPKNCTRSIYSNKNLWM